MGFSAIGLLLCALWVGTSVVHLLEPWQPLRYFYGGSCFEDHTPSQVPAIVSLTLGLFAAAVLSRALVRRGQVFAVPKRVRGLTLSMFAGATAGSLGVALFKLSSFSGGVQLFGFGVGPARVWVSCAAFGLMAYHPLHDKFAEEEARSVRGPDVVQLFLPFALAPIAAVLVHGWPY